MPDNLYFFDAIIQHVQPVLKSKRPHLLRGPCSHFSTTSLLFFWVLHLFLFFVQIPCFGNDPCLQLLLLPNCVVNEPLYLWFSMIFLDLVVYYGLTQRLAWMVS